MTKFSDMIYTRPNLDELKAKLKAAVQKLENSADETEAFAAFEAFDKLNRHITTLDALASIRHSIDTRDEFYEAEAEFWNKATPELEEYVQQFTDAALNSKFRSEMEQKYGDIVFINAEISRRTFAPELIPLLQEENQLVRKYEKLLATSAIEYDGKTYTISQIQPFKQQADDEKRLAAWKAEGGWFKTNQKELDDIYDRLVQLRNQMGQKLGHENFVPLGYDRMGRNCYTRKDVERFRSAVVKYVVPLANEIFMAQAKRMGMQFPLSFADAALSFRSGNAIPAGTADDIVAAAGRFYDELSPETGEFWRMMIDGELMSLIATDGKAGGGFCTGIYDYEVPFIFANFNGTRDDVETVTHEAGHAFAEWTNRKRVPMQNCWPTLEACEVHSMSMEFFSWPWAERFFGSDTAKFKFSHLASAITFIPYGTMVDHFQHIVYLNPELSPAERHAEWKKLLGIYMPWLRLDGEIPLYSDGEGWQRQHHIYSSPFYYIDYCFAQTVALEFWAMIQDDLKGAWKQYMAYTSLGGSLTFTELLEKAELESPFDENCLKRICFKAKEWLENFDLNGIE